MIGKGPALGPEQLLVMSDGMPTNAPRRDVSRIPSLIDLNMVERIELVAGASSLYGAGATGGAVSTAIRGFPRYRPFAGAGSLGHGLRQGRRRDGLRLPVLAGDRHLSHRRDRDGPDARAAKIMQPPGAGTIELG